MSTALCRVKINLPSLGRYKCSELNRMWFGRWLQSVMINKVRRQFVGNVSYGFLVSVAPFIADEDPCNTRWQFPYLFKLPDPSRAYKKRRFPILECVPVRDRSRRVISNVPLCVRSHDAFALIPGLKNCRLIGVRLRINSPFNAHI